jgi:hypothetical protein
MAADLTTQLSLCRARKVRAETAVGDAEASYQTALRGGDDAQVEKAIRALDGARRGLVLETDREAALQSALAEEARQAERAAEAAKWKKAEKRIADAVALAEALEVHIGQLGVMVQNLEATMRDLPGVRGASGKPETMTGVTAALAGVYATLANAGHLVWAMSAGASEPQIRSQPGVIAAVKSIAAKLTAQRGEETTQHGL